MCTCRQCQTLLAVLSGFKTVRLLYWCRPCVRYMSGSRSQFTCAVYGLRLCYIIELSIDRDRTGVRRVEQDMVTLTPFDVPAMLDDFCPAMCEGRVTREGGSIPRLEYDYERLRARLSRRHSAHTPVPPPLFTYNGVRYVSSTFKCSAVITTARKQTLPERTRPSTPRARAYTPYSASNGKSWNVECVFEVVSFVRNYVLT
jgi:hypothetical protein